MITAKSGLEVTQARILSMLNVKWYSFHRKNIRRFYENQPAKKEMLTDTLHMTNFISQIFPPSFLTIAASP